MHTLYYGAPIAGELKGALCYDIGAVWSVSFHVSERDRAWDLETVECTGVDENVHGPWLVVRQYLDSADRIPPSSTGLFLRRWLSSAKGREYAARSKKLDASNYRRFGAGGECIDVLSAPATDRATLRAGADCHLRLSGEPIYLLFHLLRTTQTGRWEIDDITTQIPAEAKELP